MSHSLAVHSSVYQRWLMPMKWSRSRLCSQQRLRSTAEVAAGIEFRSFDRERGLEFQCFEDVDD